MRCAFVSLAVILPHASCLVLPPVAGTQRWLGLEHHTANAYPHRRAAPCRLADDFVVERLTSIKQMYEELGARLEDPEIMADTSELLRVTRERSKLEETVETFDNYMSLEEQLTDAKEMFGETDDPEMREMAREEVKEIEGTLEELDEKLKLLLLPTDPNDEKNCMLEIRAGTGGDEAAIWASDLAKLYTKYASSQGWATRVISQSESDAGGLRDVTIEVRQRLVSAKAVTASAPPEPLPTAAGPAARARTRPTPADTYAGQGGFGLLETQV